MRKPDVTSASEIATRIRRGDLTATEVVRECLTRIEDRDDINAFVTVFEEDAMENARHADAVLAEGRSLGPLHGVPVAVKDLFDFKAGERNTFGSVPFAAYVPERSSTYVERLESAGAIVVGKTNTPEFGHKGVTDNRLFGPTSTPFDTTRNAGGSSGGSAAAVADGLVPLAQGSDGGGSIRIPASFCGVYGFKATYGRVAQEIRPDAFLSHTPFIHSGPITRTVEDAALMLDVMAGPHPRDPLSVPDDGTDFTAAITRNIDDLDVAYSPDAGGFPIDGRVRDVVDDAVDVLAETGATIQQIDLEFPYSHVELSEMWLRQIGTLYQSMLEGFRDEGIDLLTDHRDELTEEFATLLEDTQEMSVVEYKQDDQIRTEIYDTLQTVLTEFDLLVTPTLAVPPIKNAEQGETVGPTAIEGEPVEPLIGWCPTFITNFTGHPSASLPAGMTASGLPIGMQLIGDRYADETVLAASAAFERIQPWHEHYPPR